MSQVGPQTSATSSPSFAAARPSGVPPQPNVNSPLFHNRIDKSSKPVLTKDEENRICLFILVARASYLDGEDFNPLRHSPAAIQAMFTSLGITEQVLFPERFVAGAPGGPLASAQLKVSSPSPEPQPFFPQDGKLLDIFLEVFLSLPFSDQIILDNQCNKGESKPFLNCVLKRIILKDIDNADWNPNNYPFFAHHREQNREIVSQVINDVVAERLSKPEPCENPNYTQLLKIFKNFKIEIVERHTHVFSQIIYKDLFKQKLSFHRCLAMLSNCEHVLSRINKLKILMLRAPLFCTNPKDHAQIKAALQVEYTRSECEDFLLQLTTDSTDITGIISILTQRIFFDLNQCKNTDTLVMIFKFLVKNKIEVLRGKKSILFFQIMQRGLNLDHHFIVNVARDYALSLTQDIISSIFIHATEAHMYSNERNNVANIIEFCVSHPSGLNQEAIQVKHQKACMDLVLPKTRPNPAENKSDK